MIWLVHYLPEAWILIITGAILGLGASVTLVSWATKYLNNPYLHMYRLPIQIMGNLLLAVGIYFHGGYQIEMDWRHRVDEAERRVKEYESRVPEVNEKVVVKYKTQVKVIERRVADNKKQNAVKEQVINHDCVLSDEAIENYNQALSKPGKEERQ